MATFDDKGIAQSLIGSSKEGDYYIVRNKDTNVNEYDHPDWLGKDVVESHVETYTDAGGIEEIILGEGGKNVVANRNVQKITGNDQPNMIWGGQGKTVIDGGAGNDSINSGIYNDTITGGAGADTFNFGEDVDWNASTIMYTDTIKDFNPDEDRIVLNTASFKALKSGFTFEVAKTIKGLDLLKSQIIYCSENGGLYYNPNQGKKGFASFSRVNGSGTFVYDDGGLFAVLANKPALERRHVWITIVDPKKVKDFQPTAQTNPVVQ
jgi:Ca2+-binding RTX toxin-like protein